MHNWTVQEAHVAQTGRFFNVQVALQDIVVGVIFEG